MTKVQKNILSYQIKQTIAEMAAFSNYKGYIVCNN